MDDIKDAPGDENKKFGTGEFKIFTDLLHAIKE